MLSTRVHPENRKGVCAFVPYKLRGTRSVAQGYSTFNAAMFRRKVAWIKVCGKLSRIYCRVIFLIAVDALDPRAAEARASKEFTEVAVDFFSGRPVEAE